MTILSASLPRELNELDEPLLTATYFGFRPIKAPRITDGDIELTKHCLEHPYYDAVEKMALIRMYQEQNLASLPHPLALVYKKPIARKKFGTHALHLIGVSSGIAEATLIQTTFAILSEKGYKNLKVDINCVGDKESIGAYERELANFVRKFCINVTDEFKQKIKEDIFNLFRFDEPEIIRLRETAPSAITHLSAQSRIYFKEVLEYIEALGIEFRLTPTLVGERNHVSQTVFAVRDVGEEESHTLAVGYRYSRLGRLVGLRKEVPMAGVAIFSETTEAPRAKAYKEMPRPKFFLVQMGREAKIKSLSLIELLRAEHIPVHHLLGKDKIAVQLSSAESLSVSHLIIIGQKEALDNTVTVRNIITRAQDTINIVQLPRYLKNIRL